MSENIESKESKPSVQYTDKDGKVTKKNVEDLSDDSKLALVRIDEISKDKMSVDYKYNVQAKQTGITNLLQDLKDAGLKLKDLKTEQSTLEKIFVTLVKENNEI